MLKLRIALVWEWMYWCHCRTTNNALSREDFALTMNGQMY